jgi:hypothetical protein
MKYTPPTICTILGILAALNAVAAVLFTMLAFSGNAAFVVPAVGAGGGMLVCFIADTAMDLLARIEFNTAVLVHEATWENEARKKNAGISAAVLPLSPVADHLSKRLADQKQVAAAQDKGPGFVQAEKLAARASELEKRRTADEAWQRAQRGE